MARRGANGAIILETQIDESGLKKGMNSMKSSVDSISGTFRKLGGIIATAFSVRAIINFSRESSQLATTTEASVQRLIDIYGEASKAVGMYIDYNARAIGMSKSAAAQFASVYGNLFSVWADRKTNAELTTDYLNMTAVVASKTGRTVADVQERVRSGLLGNTEAIEDLGIFVNIKTIEITDAFQRIANGRSWDKLSAYEQQQVRTLAILEQATSKYGNTVAQTNALTRAQYNAAFEDFKNTWGTVINYILMPILRVATQVFDVLTRGLQVIASLSGKTIDTSIYKEQENAIGGTVDNQNALTNATKETAKEQKKLLAGFDDLQIISSNSDEVAGNGEVTGATASSVGAMPDLGGSGDMGGKTQEINEALSFLMGVIGGALAAVGLLVLFSGNVPWGIGFIIAGAALFAVSAASLASGEVSQNAANAISTLFGIIGGALIALGVMLLFLGSTAWGIGFIIAGAAALGVGIATIVKFGANDIQQTIMMIEGIAAGALLALGIILLVFGGPSPLSIGLIIAGATLLAITVAQIVAGQAESDVSNMIHKIVAIVSAALLAIGIILLFTPVSWGLALGLIAAGAIGLATEAALNWDAIITALQGPIGKIVAIVSAALLVLGIILLLTGAGIPLGLGLIAAGAVGLAAAIAPNWDFILSKIKEIWGNVKIFWNDNIAPWFTKEKWIELVGKIGTGLKNGFKSAINGVITIVEKGINYIIDKINTISWDVPDWVPGIGGQKWGFNFKNVKIPRLAQGAVIPPNKEFLAVLGDQKRGVNIETPLETMIEAFQAALENRNVTSGGSSTVILEIDGREFGRAVVEQGNKETRRVGTRLVIA